MATTQDTVIGRIDDARTELTAAQAAFGLLLVGLFAGALLFAQEPALHDAMHDFRHAAGVTCH
jgi:cobalt transporter subunit CbtB